MQVSLNLLHLFPLSCAATSPRLYKLNKRKLRRNKAESPTDFTGSSTRNEGNRRLLFIFFFFFKKSNDNQSPWLLLCACAVRLPAVIGCWRGCTEAARPRPFSDSLFISQEGGGKCSIHPHPAERERSNHIRRPIGKELLDVVHACPLKKKKKHNTHKKILSFSLSSFRLHDDIRRMSTRESLLRSAFHRVQQQQQQRHNRR